MDTQLQIEVLARRSRWNVEQTGRDFAGLIRYGFAVLFLVTGLAKLASGEAFIDAIRGYELVPTGAIDLVAAALIVTELGLGVWLASGYARRAALWAAAVSLLGFGAIVAIAVWRGATGDCGCFSGVAESSIGLGAIVRNAALAAVAINAAVVERPRAMFNNY
jgi:uncharacterized membrane protein YphA (DoxX/SURF4 family)